MAEIVLTGLSLNDPVPGEYVEVAFAQGDSSQGSGTYSAVLIGNMLSTGAASVSTVYGPATSVPMTSEADAITLFGAGSELHRMVRRFLEINQTTPLNCIAVAEGSGATAGTGTITISGPATSAGTLRVFLHRREFVDVGFVSGDSATTIGAAVAVAINGRTHWPYTAANASGTITLTSKQKGLRTGLIRYSAQVKPFSGTGVTVTPTTSTAFTAGSVTDSLATALTVLATDRYYYVVPAAEDSTQLAALKTWIDTQAAAVTGLRQRWVAGSSDTIANTITIVDAVNQARGEIAWLYQSDVPPCEMAAAAAAVYSLREQGLSTGLNFNFYGDGSGEVWTIPSPMTGAGPTRSQLVAALNAGVTPIGVRSSGNTYIVKRITSRYKNGAVVDYRIRDAHKVTVCDRYGDDLIAKAAAQFRGKKIGDVPVTDAPIDPNVVTIVPVKAAVNQLTSDYGANGLVDPAKVAEIQAQTLVQRDSPTRISAKIPLQPIDILDQLAFRVDQVA